MGKVSKKWPVRPDAMKRAGVSNISNSQCQDGRTTKTSKLHKAINKKQKQQLKHKMLMNKFVLAKKLKKEETQKKNREKTAVIGDLKPLKDALPSLNELFQISQKGILKTGVKKFDEQTKKLNTRQKIKRKRINFISKVNAFQSLLNDPDFKQNPRDAVAYHIKCTYGLQTD